MQKPWDFENLNCLCLFIYKWAIPYNFKVQVCVVQDFKLYKGII